ncbi:uncharacterized protein UHO2_00574 [Ustilago hordei]|uniref:Uncharacterized protein n=1 Tax=Ustilago hordei TaxID=120017 RepID=I2FW55_USTHO|nr:uncharacterized protein UHO2_00574 [Ustilago hordei]CCF51148.1 uncharacterized protein UHOR_14805 [Ustilago hordei]SYW82089.1 uncharacterized protein UHO2_00574 [Ustilago hordei]
MCGNYYGRQWMPANKDQAISRSSRTITMGIQHSKTGHIIHHQNLSKIHVKSDQQCMECSDSHIEVPEPNDWEDQAYIWTNLLLCTLAQTGHQTLPMDAGVHQGQLHTCMGVCVIGSRGQVYCHIGGNKRSTVLLLSTQGFRSQRGQAITTHRQPRMHSDHVQEGDVDIDFVRTASNVADILTKPLKGVEKTQLAKLIGLEMSSGGGVKDTTKISKVA